MAYASESERTQYQKCENCLFNKNCFWQEIQRYQEDSGDGNNCLFYQDERDLPDDDRTERYERVKDLPEYTLRIKKPIAGKVNVY